MTTADRQVLAPRGIVGVRKWTRAVRAWAEAHPLTFAALAVALSTLLFLPGRDRFAEEQWGMGYLLVTVVVANQAGASGALLAAVLSFFAWNFFFLSPFYTLRLDNPQHLTFLAVFLVVGVVIGLRTATLRRRESEARASEREALLLGRLSEGLLSLPSIESMADLLLESLREGLRADDAAVFVLGGRGRLRAYWSADAPSAEREIAQTAEEVRRSGERVPSEREPASTLYVPLHGPNGVVGVLYVGGRRGGTYGSDELRLVSAIANTASVFLEQARLREVALQHEALREAERLKSVLVSSISHELKTPLASAKATVTGLLEGDVQLPPEALAHELGHVVHDLGRLEADISDLLDLARLESGEWRFEPDAYEIGEIIGSVLAAVHAEDRRRIELRVPDRLPPVRADFRQLARAIGNLVQNALQYSPPGSPVRVVARLDGDSLLIDVEDRGAGVPEAERSRVFEKFYRGRGAAGAGTGLGLAITHEIVTMHGGSVSVEDADDGARFTVSLPVAWVGGSR